MKRGKRDILCIGELTLDEIGVTPKIRKDESATILTGLVRSFGGRGSNFLMFSKIFNADTLLVGPVGNDFASYGYLNYLKRADADTSGLFRSSTSRTPRAFVFGGKGDSRTFFYGGVLDEQRRAFCDHALRFVKTLDYGVLYSTAGTQEINELSLSKSRAELNSYAPGQETAYASPKSLDACLRHTDVLFLNESEARIMQEKTEKSIEGMAIHYQIGIIAVTLGKSGSRLYVKGTKTSIPSFKPLRVVSTAGAGDAFAGAFMANYLKTHDPVDSAMVASATASFVVEKMGCQSNIPSAAMVAKRLRARG